MRRMCVLCVLVVLFLGVAMTARAEGEVPLGMFKAANFALLCSNEHREFQSFCIGYITGAVDAFQTITEIQKRANKGGFENDICLPLNVKAEDLRPIVIDYMLRHPDRASDDAFLLIYWAIIEKWQCR